jgi:type I restriction enzyme S subunit
MKFRLKLEKLSAKELFSKLDAGVKELKAAQEKLKQYRASVLAAACSGKLVPTEAELAKAEGRNYESGVELLERILKERREKWNGRGKYKEPILPDASKLLELPEGWVWTTWEQLSSRVTVGYVGSMKNEYRHEGVPFLRSQNVRANRFDPEGLTFISKEFHEALKKSSINGGDLAVVRSGSVGTTCVIPEDLGEANCSDLVLVQKPIGIRAHFGAYYMNSIAKKLIESGKVGVALTHFNTQSVAQLPVPLPPPQEQERIINTVEKILGTIETLSLILSSNLQRSERLRQSILQQAFSGKLVPQDENDEPASALLERIKAEQANTASKKSSKKSAHSNTVTE